MSPDKTPDEPQKKDTGPDRLADSEPRSSAADELRYEGPITFDDLPDEEHLGTETSSNTSRTLVMFALISFVVFVIVAAAIYLRDDTSRSELPQFVRSEPPPAIGEQTDPALPSLEEALPTSAGSEQTLANPKTDALSSTGGV
ncbi:MAG: hypothetical protein JSV80_04595, partial [Acidobacteriota bacterium]